MPIDLFLRRPLAGVWLLGALAACSHTPPANEQLGAGRAAVEAAMSAGAGEANQPELALARDKLSRAQAAARAGDNLKARRLAEEADVDAQVARSKIGADQSRKAVDEIDASLATLREEMDRSSSNGKP